MPPKNNQVYIAGLPDKANEDFLKEHFEKFGKIKEASIKRRYGFVVNAHLHHV
jgi:RNA recognition motif-containing protein